MKRTTISKSFISNAMRTLLAVFTIALFAVGFSASDDETLSDITINGVSKHEMTLELGETMQLTVSGVTDVEWESDDESVATVTPDGQVTAMKVGVTRLSVYPKSGDVRNGNYVMVTVVNIGVDVENDYIDQSEAE